jgi:hypothetical protein
MELEAFIVELKTNPQIIQKYPNLGDLTRFLTDNIYLVNDIVDILILSGFKPGYINLQGSAINVWSDAIRYAQAQDQLVKLLEGVVQYLSEKQKS